MIAFGSPGDAPPADLPSKVISQIASVLQEMEKSAPRTAAILACALLDNNLKDAIESRFVDSSSRHSKFFDSPGRDTAAKIAIGYALGIYGKPECANLEAINTIRNKFAHRLAVDSFEHEALRGAFENITLWSQFKQAHPVLTSIKSTLKPDKSDKRSRFVYSFIYLHYTLLMDVMDERERPVAPALGT